MSSSALAATGPAPEDASGPAVRAVLDNVVAVYVAAVFFAGIAIAATALANFPIKDVPIVLVFALAGAAAEVYGVTITEDSRLSVSLSLAVILATAVTAGPAAAIVVAIIAATARILRRPRPTTQKMLFNIGLFAIEAGVTSIAYTMMGGQLGHRAPGLQDALACLVALGAYFAATWPLLAIIVHLTTARTVRQIWDDFRWMPVQIAVSATIGVSLGAAYNLFGWGGAAVYVAPLLAVRAAMRQYTTHVAGQMEELRTAHAEADEANQKLVKLNRDLDVTNEGLLRTLASVIDARDIYLYGHSVQASKYAGEVARIMGLDEHQVRTTELGALLHDLGKIGVSEAILNKPARLTDAEYEEIKAHCEIGYQLLSNLPQFEEVAEIVYSHHEEYDGTGYPRQLKGEEIPIGARIVSVVESTEAMISDRPYRRGMTPDEVLRELANGAGTQWDPEVVRIFSGMLSQDRKHLKMRNSALEIALSRTPIAELVSNEDAPSLEGVTATFHGATQPIFILDQDYAIVAANPAAERLTGFSEAQLQELGWTEMTGTAGMNREVGHNFFSSARVVQLQRAEGEPVDLEVTGTPLQTNSASYWMVMGHDVSAAMRQREGAVLDPLTDLPTVDEFELQVRTAIAQGLEPLTVLVLDIDAMEAINGTFGREVGNEALQLLARVMRSQLRQGDMAARLEEDTFAILMRRATLADAGRVVQRLDDALPPAAQAFDLDCVVEFCSGAAQWSDGESYQELMARARLWMEAEKRSRRPSSVVPLPLGRQRPASLDAPAAEAQAN